MASVATKFYTFHQNNSGGSLDHNPEDGIGTTVWIEAVDAAHANALAQLVGLYFDGCDSGLDCDCCGDRWYAVSEHDGDTVPRLYSEEWREAKNGEEPTTHWGGESYIHRLDGTFKAAVKVEG